MSNNYHYPVRARDKIHGTKNRYNLRALKNHELPELNAERYIENNCVSLSMMWL